ncbi:MAG: MptD family putative ECF transporter S component [Lachnospiraceae bacterium]
MPKMGTNKWSLKDVITLAIFTVIIFVVLMIVMVLSNILLTPVGAYFASPGISALLAGPFYMVMTNKISKRGVVFLICTITGLLFLAVGQVYTFVIYVIFGVIGELCMLGQDAYQKLFRNMAGFLFYMVALSASAFIPMILFRDQFLAWYSTFGTEETISTLIQVYGGPSGILITVALTAAGSILGCMIGQRILNRHVKKARI